MTEIPLNPLVCILCDELVYASDDEKTWGIDWQRGGVHYHCAYTLFDAIRRVQGKPEVARVEGENGRLREALTEQLGKQGYAYRGRCDGVSDDIRRAFLALSTPCDDADRKALGDKEE